MYTSTLNKTDMPRPAQIIISLALFLVLSILVHPFGSSC